MSSSIDLPLVSVFGNCPTSKRQGEKPGQIGTNTYLISTQHTYTTLNHLHALMGR